MVIFLRFLAAFYLISKNHILVESFCTKLNHFQTKCNRFPSTILFSTKRRQVLSDIFRSTTIISFLTLVQPSNAGELGAKINKAVTTSNVGISVRRSVVRGAQTMDQLDKQWELFSDKFGLGASRFKQGSRPKAKYIPPLLPLDVVVAGQILEICDEIFCEVANISSGSLRSEIEKVQTLVKPSFQRAGVVLDSTTNRISLETGIQFDFASYVHFRAYSNLLVSYQVNFRPFQHSFEENCGEKLLKLLQPQLINIESSRNENRSSLEGIINENLKAVQTLTHTLRDKGLVAASEMSTLDSEQVADWADDSSDLQFTLALDGDVTMKAQILLQEQGYNLIPNFAKFMVKKLLTQQLPNEQKLSMEEYYMDTNYNSDPDLYEAKEVLLNIVLERK